VPSAAYVRVYALIVFSFSGLYGCEVENILIDSPNVRIGNIAGVHQEGNSNLEVEYLWIKDSQVTHLPHFDAEVFFPNFKKYLITDSKLKYVKRDDFAGMPKLETLNLVDNEIEEFPEDMLYDLGGLVDLFIDGNRLKALPTYLLNHAPLFQRFKANNNSIEALDKDFFKTNFALKIVSLDNNRLQKIGVNFKPYKNLKKIDLKNNACVDTYFNDWRKYQSAEIVQQQIEATCR
jgi:Leucine-rich repeat (LRR) protein